MGAVLVALGAIAALSLGLGGGFILDDQPNIVQNAALHLSRLRLADVPYAVYSFQPGHGSRMLSMATFAFDGWRSGMDPRAFKATNLAIHAATTIALAWLIYLLLIQAGRPPRRAAAAALALAAFWALHPLQVSSVFYVVQRMQTLVTLFAVLALIAYVRMRQAQINGERSRGYAVYAALFMVLGVASKEDAALYPLYALALEVTLLRFTARIPVQSRVLRWSFLALGAISLIVFTLYVLPHNWHQQTVPGRQFSSVERLLTQARVLVMYIGQALFPAPANLPFYYDTFPVSHNVLDPWTTAASMLVLAALLVWAWAWRARRPLFSLGILLFFAGHVITSNVLNLELVFEHRNQFPLIGIVLAVGDLWALGWQHAKSRRLDWALAALALCVTTGCTILRAYEWGDPIRFARYSVSIRPDSPRAGLALAGAYYEASRGDPRSPLYQQAIDANEAASRRTGTPAGYSNVVIYKTRRGDVTSRDWDNLVRSAQRQPVTLQVQFMLSTMLNDADNGIPLDSKGMTALINAIAPRGSFGANDYRRFGAYIYNNGQSPADALRYLKLSVELSPEGDADTERMFRELTEAGSADWVARLRQIPRTGKQR
ncbi:hypothetical protein DWG18_00915 [Lysobacter sp. TY2-98]|uniref:hypothetical protein n=1 Tax=Lysobacter sp. TY2-98 TaxID=2290922 RepID=UPI000E205C6D|nr:hypothetical protein [Lysobacter sp. TY2-98]AXK70988.1 hypothetical protein DWG18_00915 [Lysobacter sp. TY2-98]